MIKKKQIGTVPGHNEMFAPQVGSVGDKLKESPVDTSWGGTDAVGSVPLRPSNDPKFGSQGGWEKVPIGTYPSQDFFGGKKNTNYSAGTGASPSLKETKYASLNKPMPTGREVPAMAEPGDPGYDLEDEIVG